MATSRAAFTPASAASAPATLHANPILGHMQMLIWLLLRPSRWRECIAQIDPDLPPDFCLVDLHPTHTRSPALRRLALWVYLPGPPIAAALVGALLLLLGAPRGQIAIGMITAAFNTFTICLAFGVLASLASGVAGGFAWGVATGLGFGVTSGVFDHLTSGIFGVGVSATICIATVFERSMERQRRLSLGRQVSGGVAGVCIGALAIAVSALLRRLSHLDPHDLSSVLVWLAVCSGVFSGAITIVAGWRRGVLYGLALGCFTVFGNIVGFGVISAFPDTALRGEVFSIGYNFAFCALAVLPYVIARYLAGPFAGVIAVVCGIGGSWMTLMALTAAAPSWSVFLLGLACLALGMAIGCWYSLLIYPFEMIWNSQIYRIERRAASGRSWLGWNAAFWDEVQPLPLRGLEDHVVLVAERRPAEADQAIAYLATSQQRWAARAAQIELEARALERCDDIRAIGAAHEQLVGGLLAGPASGVLNSFSRISTSVAAALGYESATNQRWFLTRASDELERLAREMTVSNDTYAQRFYPIARRWRQIVEAAVRQVVEEIERRQEIDSPYVVGLPLTEAQDIFTGRTDTAARIEDLLRGARCPPLLLYGQRRVGKTSLLNNLGRLLPHAIVPLFVDLQGCASHDEGHARLLYNIARDMRVSALQRRGLSLPPLPIDDLSAAPFTGFSEWLDAVEQAIEHAGHAVALLTFDEVETLYSALEEGLFSERKVLGALRNLIQHRPRFKVLLAGSHTLDELHRWSSYLINVQPIKIGYLNEHEARGLIEQPMADFALRYEQDASARVLALTRRHPYLVQLLCREIVALKNEHSATTRRLARLADVEAAVPRALDSSTLFFADIQRNQVRPAGLLLLRYVAAQGAEAVVSRATLSATFHEDLDDLLDQLVQRDLIEQVADGYRFQVELVRRWFDQPARRSAGLSRHSTASLAAS